MRRLIVLAIVAPYAIVMWPRWIARDFVDAFRCGWRNAGALRAE